MYTYNSIVGIFTIRPAANGRWLLSLDNDPINSYSTAERAADAVLNFQTDNSLWDDLDGEVDAPETLSDWLHQ